MIRSSICSALAGWTHDAFRPESFHKNLQHLLRWNGVFHILLGGLQSYRTSVWVTMDMPRVWWFFVRPLWIQKLMTFAWHIMVSVYVAVSVCWNLDQKQNDRLKFQGEENHPSWWRLKNFQRIHVELLSWKFVLIITSQGKFELLFSQVTLLPGKWRTKILRSLRFEEQHNWGTRMDCRWWFSNIRSNFNLDIFNLQYTMVPSLFPWTSHPKRIF